MKGEILREKLKRTGVSFASLARKLDIHPQSLTSLFKGADVKSGMIERMAAILNLPISYFYEDYGGEANPSVPVEVGTREVNAQNITNINNFNSERIRLLTQEVEFLKEKLMQKDLIIKEKEKIVELYDYMLKEKFKNSSI